MSTQYDDSDEFGLRFLQIFQAIGFSKNKDAPDVDSETGKFFIGFIDEMDQKLGDARAVLMLPSFMPIFAAMRKQALDWAKTELKKSPDRKSIQMVHDSIVFAGEIREIYALTSAKKQQTNQEKTLDSSSRISPQELMYQTEYFRRFLEYGDLSKLTRRDKTAPHEQRWIDIMTSETTPKSINFLLADFLIHSDHQLPVDDFYACLSIIGSEAKSRPTAVMSVLSAGTLGMLSLEKDERWKKAAGRWSTVLKQTILKSNQTRFPSSQVIDTVRFLSRMHETALLNRWMREQPRLFRNKTVLAALL